MKLYYHPLSSYSQKVLIAFHEKGVAFEPSLVDLMSPTGRAEYKKLNPLCKLPFLVAANDWRVPESSIIIEYLDQHHPGAKMLPSDPDKQRQTRFKDRFVDFYINDPMQKIFFDGFRPEGKKDPFGVEQAHDLIESALTILDGALEREKSTWAMGDTFSLADCAAAPALFYCRNVHPFDKFKNVTAYANRLMERPSYKKVLDEAQPYLAALMSKK